MLLCPKARVELPPAAVIFRTSTVAGFTAKFLKASMARNERSAGFIAFHAPARAGGSPEYLVLNYGRHWDFPKGHVDPGEDDLAAALRELWEETGIDQRHVRVVPGFQHEITYFFRD